MRMERLSTIFFLLLQISVGSAQVAHRSDSTYIKHQTNYWKSFRVPLILVGTGLIASTDNGIFDKWEVRELRQDIAPNFHTHVDNYLVAVPVVAVFALDVARVPARNDVLNQSLLLVKSEVLVTILTFSLKTFTNVQRPDGTTHDSFPSGHTSQAFMAATFLHKEFGQGRPWISILGYTTASGVGILRIMNDRHWVSDVLVGAGIGIFSSNLVYITHKHKWGKRPRAEQARILPFYQQGSAGFYFAYTFNGK
jgi:membrane-associated phospholipid phosphatase